MRTNRDNPDFHQIGKPGQIERMIAAAASMNLPGRVELLRAVRSGSINLMEVDRLAVAPMKALEQSPRPVVMLLGDDDYRSTGPAGWTAWQRLSYWARVGMVHATGADAPSYQLAVAMAVMHRRMLLIETDSAHAHDWGAALQGRNIQAIGLLPPDGAHPVMSARETVQ